MINIIDKNKLIIMYRDGKSKRFIARDLGISRNTVDSYIREYEQKMKELSQETDKSKIAVIQELICSKPIKKNYSRNAPAFTPEVERRFLEHIKKDENRDKTLGPNKQKVTAVLLHKALVNEGYKIGETTIRAKFREYKEKHKECFIKQYYEYGFRAEYDFHQIKVKIADKVKVYHQVTISLPKSNYVFAILYKNEKMETLLDSLVRFFAHCNGVFKEVVFDNMSNVVKRFVCKGEKVLTDEIIKISNYYGFIVNLTNARSGNEKGHVENSGKTIRRDMFALKYEFETEEELYLYYATELEKRNNPFIKEFEIEKQYLFPNPVHNYELGRLEKAKVSPYSFISIDTNFYSVPDKYVGKHVNCNVYVDFFNVFDDKANLIARHNKKDGKGEYAINIMHYIDTFLKKPGALRNSLALKQAPAVLQTIFNKYFITNPKKFLDFLMDSDSFDDIDGIAMELGIIKKKYKHRTNPKYLGGYTDTTIDEISKNQLDYTSELFGQKGRKK